MYIFIRLGKTTLLLVMSVLLLFTAASCSFDETSDSKVNWLYDWDEASIKAQNENKPIMIDFYTEWCDPCKMLDSNTYSDDELGNFLNDNFICLKSNAGKSDLYEDYGLQGVPTIVFTSPEGTEFGRLVGYRGPDQYYEEAQAILSQWES